MWIRNTSAKIQPMAGGADHPAVDHLRIWRSHIKITFEVTPVYDDVGAVFDCVCDRSGHLPCKRILRTLPNGSRQGMAGPRTVHRAQLPAQQCGPVHDGRDIGGVPSVAGSRDDAGPCVRRVPHAVFVEAAPHSGAGAPGNVPSVRQARAVRFRHRGGDRPCGSGAHGRRPCF